MKILVIGNGGREHALGWALSQDSRVTQLFFAPGNAGTARLGETVPVSAGDVEGLTAWAREQRPDLTVVGPEVPLCAGVVDAFEAEGLRIFGPNASAARLEGSKVFTKDLLNQAGIPTAQSERFTEPAPAREYCSRQSFPLVIKADGLAAGKGVIIAQNEQEAHEAVHSIMEDKAFGTAGDAVLVEEFLDGEEMSVHAITDGKDYVLLPSSQDHKRIGEGDTGPNTGGMGAYSPSPRFTPEMCEEIQARVFRPLLDEFARRGIEYKGVLYGGLMLTAAGPKVLEFNCRFGDPETQVLLPMLETPLLDLMNAAIEGTLSQLSLSVRQRAAITVVLAAPGYPGKVETGGVIEGLEDVSEAEVFHAGTKAAGDTVVTAGGRVLTVTAWGGTLREAADRVYPQVGKIRFEGRQYRRDIGHRALSLESS